MIHRQSVAVGAYRAARPPDGPPISRGALAVSVRRATIAATWPSRSVREEAVWGDVIARRRLGRGGVLPPASGRQAGRRRGRVATPGVWVDHRDGQRDRRAPTAGSGGRRNGVRRP